MILFKKMTSCVSKHTSSGLGYTVAVNKQIPKSSPLKQLELRELDVKQCMCCTFVKAAAPVMLMVDLGGTFKA